MMSVLLEYSTEHFLLWLHCTQFMLFVTYIVMYDAQNDASIIHYLDHFPWSSETIFISIAIYHLQYMLTSPLHFTDKIKVTGQP